MAEAELIGLPQRSVIGDKSLKDGLVESQYRDGRIPETVAPEAASGRIVVALEKSTK